MNLLNALRLKLNSLSGAHPKTLLSSIKNNYLFLAKTIPGVDMIFLGVALKELKFLIGPLTVSNSCDGMFWSWVFDLYCGFFIVTGVVIYFTRRYVLARKTS